MKGGQPEENEIATLKRNSKPAKKECKMKELAFEISNYMTDREVSNLKLQMEKMHHEVSDLRLNIEELGSELERLRARVKKQCISNLVSAGITF